MEPSVSRTMWQVLEPIHAMIYFAPEAQEEYAGLGIDVAGNIPAGYFPFRAAPMGPVEAPVVQATFFNFSPAAVHAGMDGVWEHVTPAQALDARHRGAARALRRMCSDLLSAGAGTEAAAEAAALARVACAAAAAPGRPLGAAHAALPWPEDPVLALWHAATVLREYRGDGHIAFLLAEEYTAIDAVVLHTAGASPRLQHAVRITRGYTEEEWAAAVEGLQGRGWLDGDGAPLPPAVESRQRIEDGTDRLALPAWRALGDEGCQRLAALAEPFTDAIIDARGVPGRRR